MTPRPREPKPTPGTVAFPLATLLSPFFFHYTMRVARIPHVGNPTEVLPGVRSDHADDATEPLHKDLKPKFPLNKPHLQHF